MSSRRSSRLAKKKKRRKIKMPSSGYGGYQLPSRTTPSLQAPNSLVGLTPPTPTYQPMPFTLPPLPPAPTLPTLAPPPALPAIPPMPQSTFLPALQQLLSQYKTAQPFQQLGPEVSALIEKYRTAALGQLEQQSSLAQGSLLGRLFGRRSE